MAPAGFVIKIITTEFVEVGGGDTWPPTVTSCCPTYPVLGVEIVIDVVALVAGRAGAALEGGAITQEFN